MSESANETTATTDTSTTDQQAEQKAEQKATETATAPEQTADLGDAGKKAIDAMKAERDAARREAKANADAAKRLADLEESQKTEAQKVADRAAAAEAARDEAIADGIRYKAAARHNVDEDHFDLLGSGDEETILARAEKVGTLLALRTENEQLRADVEALKQGKPAPSQTRPISALKPGATAETIEPAKDDSYPADFLTPRQRERIAART